MSEPVHYINVYAPNTNLVGRSILGNTEYSTQIVCDEGYSIYEITIKMGGVDITSTAYDPTYNMISIASVTDDVDIECYAMHTMPSDYIRVDGIKNPSNAYVNTGYKTSYKNVIKVDFTKATGYVIATKASGSTTVVGTVLRVYDNGTINYDQNISGMRSAGNGSDTGRNTWVFNHYGGEECLNGTKVMTYNKGSNIDGNNMWLYQCPVAAGQTSSTGMIIHFFSIFDGTTKVYERYYIPCLNASGVAGFWDAARGVFQGSSNSTAFEAVAADGGDFRLIDFEDSAVKDICVTNWGGHYKAGEMYTPEARAVTTFGNKFENNQDIVKFNEMQYFTGLTTLSRYVSSQYFDGMHFFGAFNRCSNLEEITLPTISITGDSCIATLFARCSKLKTVDMSPITVRSKTYLYGICRENTAMTSVILPNMSTTTSYLAMMYAFTNCSNLATIDASRVNFANLNYSNDSKSFSGCAKLTRIIGGLSGFRQTETTIKVAPLTHDAAVELLESLGTVTEARTLTLKTSTYNTLTAEEKAIATDKGWTLNYAN